MRTIYCGALNHSHIDQEITICGWVHRRRDHGGVIFIDLRDREGIVQVVFDPDSKEYFDIADLVRSEYVLRSQVSSAPDRLILSILKCQQGI